MVRQTGLRAFPARRTAWAWMVGTFFGAGLLGPGPGTFGSAAAMLLWLGAGLAAGGSREALAGWTAAASAVAVLVGIPAATIVARESGREDPGHVVIDEVAGQWIALLGMTPTWGHALLGLGLFRLFDIVKPPPVRQLEALPGGAGIMMDDVAAGAMALLVGQMLVRVAGLH